MDNNNLLNDVCWGVFGFIIGGWLYKLFTRKKKK